MLGRILERSLTRQRRRKLLSLGAVALGMTVATAVTTIALDVGDKVNRELRSFGANIAVTPATDGLTVAVGGVDYRPAGAGAFLAQDNLPKLKKIFWRHNILAFVPYLSAPVMVRDRRVILTGTWFEKTIQVDRSELFSTGLARMHPGWRVRGQWPKAEDESGCLVGRGLAEALAIEVGQTLQVSKLETRNSKSDTGDRELKTGTSKFQTGSSELNPGKPEQERSPLPASLDLQARG